MGWSHPYPAVSRQSKKVKGSAWVCSGQHPCRNSSMRAEIATQPRHSTQPHVGRAMQGALSLVQGQKEDWKGKTGMGKSESWVSKSSHQDS